jgi:potassium efflux system protein
LSDPEPLITFDEFGDNSLLITIRFFLEELDMRLSTASEVRVMINERFNELGIVVAFPQRDVHLDTSGPLEVTMVERGASI